MRAHLGLTCFRTWDTLHVVEQAALGWEAREGRERLARSATQLGALAREVGGAPEYVAQVEALSITDAHRDRAAFIQRGVWPLRLLRPGPASKVAVLASRQPPTLTAEAARVLLGILTDAYERLVGAPPETLSVVGQRKGRAS